MPKAGKRNIKFTVMYDGSSYAGWQRLGETGQRLPVQEVLEKVLGEALGESSGITGSGRTDRGVHALGQTANFYTHCSRELLTMRTEINQKLPEDIRVLTMEEVPLQFHSRYDVKSKTYVYCIDQRDCPSVFLRKYSYWVPEKLEIGKMNKAAEYLLGEHDFRGFAGKMKDRRSTVKRLDHISITKNKCLEIQITGNGFLYHMVRIIVGTLLEIGKGNMEEEVVKEIISKGDRSLAGPMAPYQGLFLKEVVYK